MKLDELFDALKNEKRFRNKIFNPHIQYYTFFGHDVLFEQHGDGQEYKKGFSHIHFNEMLSILDSLELVPIEEIYKD